LTPRTVLILHSSAQRYGSDAQLLAIVRGLDPGRWRAVTVLPERGVLAALLEDAGAEVVVHPLAVLRRALSSPRGAAALARAAAGDRRVLGELAIERGAAVVHANTSVVLSSGAVARRAGAAHLIHVREIYAGSSGPMTGALWPLMRRRLERADALACISRAVARQFGGSPRAELIYDGLPETPEPVDREAARRSLEIAGNRFVVALVGRVSDWKGQDVLIRALAQTPLVANGAIALLAGDAHPGAEAHERRLVALAGQLGVTERVRQLGFRDDVGTVLGAADVLVVPSTRPEPLGLVAMEGAAAGLPVVASAHGGVTELVRHGVTGMLVAPGHPEALAMALRLLADDPALARRLGEAGRTDVTERFPVDRMLARLQAIYDRLADAGWRGAQADRLGSGAAGT
jgi:glycosyltransferase involved in cell wall biosynthesis